LTAESARLRNVRWRWRVAQGTRLLLAAAEAVECDLFVPGRASRRTGPGGTGRVAVVHGDPAHSARALAIVQALAGNGHVRELVLVCEARPGADLLARLGETGVRVYVQAAAVADPQAVLGGLQDHAPGLLIAPRELMLPAGAAPVRGLDALSMSLLLLR